MLFSEHSRQGLTSTLERCARSTLVRSENAVCQIALEPAGTVLRGDPLVVITTTSFAFRLLTMFHVDDTEANRAYFVPTGSTLTLQEGFAEFANLCCGALNRELSPLYPHLAMSIPCTLRAQCIEHLPQLKPEYTSHFTVTIDDSVKVGVTLCMCCSAAVEIPVQLNTVQQTSGELEMF